MEIVLEIVTPVFAVLLMGYGARRIGWFSEQSAAGLAKFVFNFAIPLFLFRTFATRDLPESIPWGLFGSYYIAVFAVYALGMVVGMAVFGRNLMGGTLTGMGCSFGNTVLLGIALGVRAFGEEGAIPLFLIISVHGLILMTGTTILLEAGRNAGSALRDLPMKIARGRAIRHGLDIGGIRVQGAPRAVDLRGSQQVPDHARHRLCPGDSGFRPRTALGHGGDLDGGPADRGERLSVRPTLRHRASHRLDHDLPVDRVLDLLPAVDPVSFRKVTVG